jgi:Domain of unknown function (DUF4274)
MALSYQGNGQRRSCVDLSTYLAHATPEDWHQVAWHWNWDSGVEPLQWIIRQDTCDRGTALLIYWKGGPRYLAQYAERGEVPEYTVEDYDLVREIEAAYLAGRYTQTQIAFDPQNDLGYDWTAEYVDQPSRHPIPERMYMTTPGRQLVPRNDMDEGYPPGVESED